jgi:hypothetical protein
LVVSNKHCTFAHVFFIVLDLRLTKGWELSGAPFFMSIPYLYIIIKIPPPLHSGRGNKMFNFSIIIIDLKE